MTTAMAVMPHADVDRAREVALSLNVPFWHQFLDYSYFEDRYVQTAEHFSGIVPDVEKGTLPFSEAAIVPEPVAYLP